VTIIEQAALRLEALRRSGLALHFADPAPAGADEVRRVGRAEAANAPRNRPIGVAPRFQLREPRRSVSLDLRALQASGHLVSMNTRSLLAEQFRCVKRPLLRNRQQQRQKRSPDPSLIMVTSALPGEGKTFCALNLAFSLVAEIGLSVLLVDADVVHPTLMARLGLGDERGLLELLTDPGLELADVALKTNVPRLTLLPAGRPHELSTELLSSASMAQLLRDLSADATDRIVLFDAPPLLLTNEAAVLASQVGQVVVVVEATRTPASAVEQAFALVASMPIVMAVLNKGRVPPPPKGSGYYYYLEGSA
jgi:exopolysaccharide/PEP-CTERM locus tyrosine autokinase